jgi:hypothetical protein
VRCEDLAEVLAGTAGWGELADRRAQRHVEGCLRCQAELAQYRRLLKALRTLRTEVLPSPPGLVGEVLAALEEVGERNLVRSVVLGRRVAYVGGFAVAAVAAGAAGALVLASRRRAA